MSNARHSTVAQSFDLFNSYVLCDDATNQKALQITFELIEKSNH